MMKRASGFGRGGGDVEARLWAKLQDMDALGYQWRRRAHFKSFTLDFVEHEALLIIELADGEPGRVQSSDVTREKVLVAAGYTVLRFWKSEANLDDVVADIRKVLEDRPATPPSPES